MRSKSTKKKKPKVIYYPAPEKGRVPYFLTSFFLTIAVALCGVGFLIAEKNSQRLGWGRDIDVFSVIDSSKYIGFTVMDNSFTVDRAFENTVQVIFKKARLAQSYIEPAPFQLAEAVGDKLTVIEQELLTDFNLIAKQ